MYPLAPALLKVGPFSPAKADTCVGFGASPVTSTAPHSSVLTSIRNLSPVKGQKVMTVKTEAFCNLTRHSNRIYLLEYQHKRSTEDRLLEILLGPETAVIPRQIIQCRAVDHRKCSKTKQKKSHKVE